MQFAPSNVPKFKYQNLHKDFKVSVLKHYEAIDRIGYRNVSAQCVEDDFIPVKTDIIDPNKQVTKKHIDERSLSFNTNFDACLCQAVNSFKYRERKYGIEQAEQWKSTHTHIAEVPLTKADGYMERFPTGFHFNFAPFASYTIKDYPRQPIDFNMEEVYYLQVQDGKPIAILWIQGDGTCFLRVPSEKANHLPLRVQVAPRDIVKYLRKRTTIRAIFRANRKRIKSPLGMYEYCNKSLIWDEENIVDRLYEIIKASKKLQDILFHYFFFRDPIL